MPEGANPAAAQTGARRSRDFSMAVFADLDLRAGSDLKALRGLVENAAHRESPRLCGPWCLPSLAVSRPSGQVQEGLEGLSSSRSPEISGMSLVADAAAVLL